jgi:hypothetical protein
MQIKQVARDVNEESNTLRTEACDSSLDDQNAVGSSGGIEVIDLGGDRERDVRGEM